MFRITKETDYGVVLMAHFAAGGRDEGVLAAKDLAAATSLPLPMVSKVLKALVHNDLLESQRGVNGGYWLARPAPEITLADIVEALEGPISMTECSTSEDPRAICTCSLESTCKVKVNWQLINRVVLGALREIRLDEMASPANPELMTIGEIRQV